MPPFFLPESGTETETALRIGDPFPELTTMDLDRNPAAIGQEHFGERATLIVFWSTWCGPCMQDLPHENELAKQYADSGLRVIGVNGDESPEVAKAALSEIGITWLNVFEGPELALSKQLQVSAWPTLFLLDAEGKVVSAGTLLRRKTIDEMEDGTRIQVDALDWTLKQLLAPSGE